MARYQIESVIVGGGSFPAYLETRGDEFKFVASLADGNEVISRSIKGLTATIKKATEVEKHPNKIPVCKFDRYDGATHYNVIGIHAGNGGLILEDANGAKTHQSSYSNDLKKPLRDEDAEKLRSLNQETRRIEKQRRELIERYEWATAQVIALAEKQQRGES